MAGGAATAIVHYINSANAEDGKIVVDSKFESMRTVLAEIAALHAASGTPTAIKLARQRLLLLKSYAIQYLRVLQLFR